MSIGVFTAMSEEIQENLLTPFMEKMDNVINLTQPIATTALLIFIMVYGYMILMGKVQAPAKEFLWRMGIIGLALTIAFSKPLYERYVMGPVIHGTTLVTKLTSEESRQEGSWWRGGGTSIGGSNKQLIKNNQSYLAGLDIVFESVNIFTTGMMEALIAIRPTKPDDNSQNTASGGGTGSGTKIAGNSGVGSPEMMMFAVIGTILTGAVMVYVTAGAILILNHVFLIVLLTIGPIFIALAAFKTTRDYAKKWLVKLVTIALTLALVTGMLGFVLSMQGTFSGQLCRVVSELKTHMEENKSNDAETKNALARVTTDVQARLSKLHILAVDIDSLSPAAPNQQLVSKIKSGCSAGMNSSTSNSNLLFVAMQYLVICLLFNRLITEMANVASAVVGASGVNGSTSEVSGGVGGVTQRGGLKSSGRGVNADKTGAKL